MVTTCSGTDPLGLRVSGGWSAFQTSVVFPDTSRRLQAFAVAASADLRVTPSVALSVSAGGILGGSFGVAMLGGGAVAGLGVSKRFVDEGKRVPFVLGTLELSGSRGSSTSGPMTAFDLRAGVAVGKTFFDHLTPYLTARAFGGPVYFEGRTGTDRYHYQVGLGVVLRLSDVDLSFEAIPLGERRVSGSMGLSF